MPAVQILVDFVSCLQCWSTSVVTTTVLPKPRHAIAALGDRILPPVLPIQGPASASSAASSSSAIAPFQPHVVARRESAEACFALGQLYERGGMNQMVNFDALANVQWDTAADLEFRGIVRRAVTEFGELHLALVPQAVTIAPAYGVTSPMPAYKVGADSRLLKLPKVSLLIMLHEDGWRSVPEVVAFAPGGPKHYKPGMTQPVSYFAALVAADRIFAKQVPQILHGCKDHYYRCLLELEKQKLLPLLENLDRDDRGWREALKKHRPTRAESSSGSSDSDTPHRRLERERLGAAGAIVPRVIPFEPALHWSLTEWQRTWVSLHGLRIKVWFDNCCSRTAQRRGWANCETCGAGKIRAVCEGRDYFACALALWHEYGYGNAGLARKDHLAFWPEDAAIRAALPECSFENF